eukprot:14300049-Ditylum_brightwellii.AAC.1
MSDESSAEEIDCVPAYMVHWAEMTGPTQNKDKKLLFVFPIFNNSESEFDAKLTCLNALTAILNVGHQKLVTIKKKQNYEHAFKGQTGENINRGKGSVGWRVSLEAFFEALKEETTPFATRVVCEQTETTYMDENPNDVMLLVYMGKHKVYSQWCWERGWIITRKRTAIGKVNPISEFGQRPHDDEAEEPSWSTGSKPLQICSWPSFHEYWKKNYPNIKACTKGADMCTNCCIFLISLQFGLEIIPGNEDKL